MMKLILTVSKDDPAVQPGGMLADRTWVVSKDIVITVKSGFCEMSANGFSTSAFGPRLNVHARNDYWQHPDFREEFDIVVFEEKLKEAKAHIVAVERYIAEMTKVTL